MLSAEIVFFGQTISSAFLFLGLVMLALKRSLRIDIRIEYTVPAILSSFRISCRALVDDVDDATVCFA